MLYSMTGFGNAILNNSLGQFYFEIKTWNNRFIDINVKLPYQLTTFESVIINEIKKKITRGKVDVFIKWEPSADSLPKFNINQSALVKLFSDLNELSKTQCIESSIDISSLLLIPGMTISISPEIDEKQFEGTLREGIILALNQVVSSRKEEGKKLAASLKENMITLENLLNDIANVKDELIERYREKLREKVRGLLGANEYNLDEVRLEAEVLFYAERSDITEEITRLKTHINLFFNYIKGASNEPVGKPMDFLCQELLRETNTIGSKSKDSQIVINVLKMKNEIEKIREQIQNIE